MRRIKLYIYAVVWRAAVQKEFDIVTLADFLIIVEFGLNLYFLLEFESLLKVQVACLIVQPYSPDGANSTRSDVSRWALPRIPS